MTTIINKDPFFSVIERKVMSTIEFYKVNVNILKLYGASKEARHLLYENSRTFKPERPWTGKNPSSLQDRVLEVIAHNFVVFAPWFSSEVFSEINRQKLTHILPTNLPLQVTSSIIPNGSFWKRSCYDHWNPDDFVLQYRDSWKNLYMQVFLQTYIQNAHPNTVNLVELKEVVDLVKDFIYILHIEQLRAIEIPGHKERSIKHVDLRPILSSLSNLEEFAIRAGIKDVGLKFTETLFELTTTDYINIARGLEKSCNLRTFKLHQTRLDGPRFQIICSSLVSLPSMEHMEFTSCYISSDSMAAFSQTIKSCISLKTLVLINNELGPQGGISLSRVLPQLKLQTLNLRMNRIGDTGACALFSSLQTHSTLRKLVLSGCKITNTSIESLVILIKTNRQIREIDLNCNDLQELTADSSIIEALKMNSVLRTLHLKMSGVSSKTKELIDSALTSNIRTQL